VAEGTLRAVHRRDTVLFPRYHTDAQYGPYSLRRLRPLTSFRHTSIDGSWSFVVNRQGFRDTRDYAYDKPPDTLRVLCLGDSQTLGFEVRQDHTYAAVLERYLTGRGYRAEVMNCAISGFSTAEELAFLENEGLRYRPDCVVLGFFANDLDDNLKADLFRVKDGALTTNKFSHLPGVAILNRLNRYAAIRWLSEHSHLYSIFFNRAWDYAKQRLSQRRKDAVSAELAVKETQTSDGVRRYQLQLEGLLIERMAAACRRAGARFVFLDIPQLAGEGMAASVPPELDGALDRAADAVFRSAEILGPYDAAGAGIFVPHGQRHLSETSHLLLGVAVGQWIAKDRPLPRSPRP
jgi:hypothetical protein